MSDKSDKFLEGLNGLEIVLSEEQMQQFLSYYEILIEKNKVMNLTAITEFDDVVEKHFLDSLSLYKVYDLRKESKILDLGTGAGFPGIPLKIAFPQIDLLLVDSLNKRVKFLREVMECLNLKKIEAIHARAEDIGRDVLFREQFDLCISRAVANLSTLIEYCLPFVKVGGTFISYKSGDIDEEVKGAENSIDLLGGELVEVYKFDLFEKKRSFVVVEKEKKTPKMYPRKAGIPSKSPL